MIEVSLPIWPFTVIYCDLIYDEIKQNYVYPKKNIEEYRQQNLGCAIPQPTDCDLFDKLFKHNHDRFSVASNLQLAEKYGHQAGIDHMTSQTQQIKVN